jgi:subtilisin family serine protease
MKNTLAIAVAMILIAVSGVLAAERKHPSAAAEPPAAADRVLVRFKDNTTDAAMSEAHARSGAKEVHRFTSVPNLMLVSLPNGKSVPEALAAYRSHPSVQYATPDYQRKVAKLPNDPYFTANKLWALRNSTTPGADIHATAAWNLTTGSHNVVVTEVDTGIDYTHPDLAANMWRNTADCFHDGIDHDHDGYVNDCYGINTLANNGDPMDDTLTGGSHGTHVAGIIGAVGDNALGVVGVNWQVSLMACKAFGQDGTTYDHMVVACFDYVLLMKQRGVDIVATNNSWGGSAYSPAVHDAILGQMRAGILFVAAATGAIGMDEDITPSYPATDEAPNVIAVTSTDSNDALTPGSASGAHTVHLGAPGGEIWSTVIGGGYDVEGGTSMATAYVSGVAALLKARNPSWDWRAIKNLILAGGDNDPALRNALNDTITGKRLNAYGSMTCANSRIQRRFRPVGTGSVPVNIPLGSRIDLLVLNINCSAPAGPVSVTVQPGNVVIHLLDDGAGTDLAAGDGLYSGVWVPPNVGDYTLIFPNNDRWLAQVFPAYAYSVVPFRWETISGANLNLSEDSIGFISLPFPVILGNVGFSSVYIDSNGKLNFSSIVESDYQNASLPDPFQPYNYMVAPFWDHLLPIQNSAQNVYWAVTGASPNRKFVVEWRNVSRANGCQDSAAQIRFQVVFSEGGGDIYFNYADTTFGGPSACAAGDHGASATVGLQTVYPIATQVSYDQPNLTDHMSIQFTPVPATAQASPK